MMSVGQTVSRYRRVLRGRGGGGGGDGCGGGGGGGGVKWDIRNTDDSRWCCT